MKKDKLGKQRPTLVIRNPPGNKDVNHKSNTENYRKGNIQDNA